MLSLFWQKFFSVFGSFYFDLNHFINWFPTVIRCHWWRSRPCSRRTTVPPSTTRPTRTRSRSSTPTRTLRWLCPASPARLRRAAPSGGGITRSGRSPPSPPPAPRANLNLGNKSSHQASIRDRISGIHPDIKINIRPPIYLRPIFGRYLATFRISVRHEFQFPDFCRIPIQYINRH